MCSLNGYDSDNSEHLVPETDKEKPISNSLCKKCRTKAAEVFLRKVDGYCNACFIIRTTHKFKAALGKSKIVRRNDAVLVAHSGKENSTTLLHLIKTAMQQSAHKKLVLTIHVVYIDEGALDGESIEERQSYVNAVCDQVKYFQFNGFMVSLSQCLREDNITLQFAEFTPSNTEKDEELVKMYNDLPDDTARKELKHQLRQRLLKCVAKILDCRLVFLANSSTDVAIKILSNVALGRGAQLSLDIGFADRRYKNLIFLRPMQDFTKEEIMQYLKYHNLNNFPSHKLTTNLNSIHTLTKNFVTDLDNEFSGTVSTIFQTGKKLNTECLAYDDIECTCVLCNAPLDTKASNEEVSAIQATAFSKTISSTQDIKSYVYKNVKSLDSANEKLPTDVPNDNSCVKCNKCTCAKNKLDNISFEDIQKCLCYSCRLTLCTSDTVKIPPILTEVQNRLSLMQMRKEISDFLL